MQLRGGQTHDGHAPCFGEKWREGGGFEERQIQRAEEEPAGAGGRSLSNAPMESCSSMDTGCPRASRRTASTTLWPPAFPLSAQRGGGTEGSRIKARVFLMFLSPLGPLGGTLVATAGSAPRLLAGAPLERSRGRLLREDGGRISKRFKELKEAILIQGGRRSSPSSPDVS